MKSFVYALYQLTRLPLPQLSFNESVYGRSTRFFPVVGFLLGAVLALLVWTVNFIFPFQVLSAFLIVAMVVLTGGIHLDGFMDSIDGLFSGRPAEKKLEIMRDSRVGAFGVIGVVCLLLLKYNLFLGMSVAALIKILPVVLALSRWCMTLAIAFFPYARPEGLGKVYVCHTGTKELLWSTVFAAVITGAFLGLQGLWLMLSGGFLTYLLGKKITGELGGLSGDIYGLINELLEVFFIAAAYPLLLTAVP